MQLSDAQIADFDRDGYLFIPDLFSQAEVDRLTADVPRIFSLDRQEILRADTGEARLALVMHRYSEPFARLLHHPRIIEPAHQLLGGPVYLHQYKLNCKDPFGKLDFPWHQDFASWHANDGMPEPKAMNFAVFLDDVTEFNGPLCFIPGSHRHGRLDGPSGDLEGAKSILHTLDRDTVARLVAEHGIVAPKGRRGSAVFFHGCMAHASGPNLSPWTRFIVYVTCNRIENHILKPTRPEWYAGQDFTPLEALADDCLLQPAAAAAAE
jgi:ectoine hydroxylase